MKILFIHNSYGKYSGEEAVVEAQMALLRKSGAEVEIYSRSSAELEKMWMGNGKAFFLALYNKRSIREIRRKLDDFNPDIVHIHNLYPLISPAILPVIKQKGIPIVMTVHNYRLICPNGLFFTHGKICERCSGGKEWNCIIHNCEYNIVKSKGYALRNFWARKKRFYLNNIDRYLCLTNFQKEKLIKNGIPEEKCIVLPNFIEIKTNDEKTNEGKYFLFAGRLNTQKGFDLLSEAASLVIEAEIIAAGEPDLSLISRISVPENLKTPGKISGEMMAEYYKNAKALVFTSRSYEGFPMVFLEAMQNKLPVVAPRMAAFPEIIEDGINGLLFEPGNADDLADKINILNNDTDLCKRLGAAGFEKLKREYSTERYREKLMKIYYDLAD